jgi:hypothetical protein
MINVRKTVATGLAVTTLSLGLAAAAQPAAAWGYHPWGWGLGGLAAGAMVGAAVAATTPVYYGACYITRQPVVNVYGTVIGYRHVRICN